jgi:hypothetical protein
MMRKEIVSRIHMRIKLVNILPNLYKIVNYLFSQIMFVGSDALLKYIGVFIKVYGESFPLPRKSFSSN